MDQNWVRFESGLDKNVKGINQDWARFRPGLGHDRTRIVTGLKKDWARIEHGLARIKVGLD